MDAYRGEIGYLIELAIIAVALVTIEFQLCNITADIIRTNVTDISESATHIHISIIQFVGSSPFRDKVKRNSIYKVRAVRTLKNTQLYTLWLTLSRTPPYLGYNMRGS